MTATPPSPLVGILGDIAPRWGMSRPAGQCLAAIWRAAQAPCADDLVAELGLSRSNISTALKELRAWGLVSVARSPGDRRDYFVAPDDPWALIGQVMAGRLRRDIAPAVDQLHAMGEDRRATALRDALSDLSKWLDTQSRRSPAELARTFGAANAARSGGLSGDTAALTGPGTAPRKKKKKKK